MLHALSEKIADFLLDKNDDYPLEVYTYGMELILSSLIEFLLLLTIGSFLNKTIDTLVFVISFSLIRFFTGGYHAKTYLRCGVVTILTYLFVIISTELLLLCDFKWLITICLIIFIFSFCIICKYAPIENENKEIHNKKKFKIISVTVFIIEFSLFSFVYTTFKFNQALIFLPTILSVDVLMLVEIPRKRGEKDEKYNEEHIEENVC